eukprot:CAMPEP_0113499462 /NCGR_PEP_ID=MMETSP0014_2-20120614/31762_1 /TAXON_ID=2857 /ORGANISM="Nitzschia sp." /LENGTH=271 /DNA_ID=CAMNT_0000393641 /DNA_START=58 /DNA_END=870 /DNA_ORIENTATION=- /assembly_acc=CAM_ASM_000159
MTKTRDTRMVSARRVPSTTNHASIQRQRDDEGTKKKTAGSINNGSVSFHVPRTSTIMHRVVVTRLFIILLTMFHQNCRILGRSGSTNISFFVEAFDIPTRSFSSTTLSSTSKSKNKSNDGRRCVIMNRVGNDRRRNALLAVLAASSGESSTANGSDGAAKDRDSNNRLRSTERPNKKDPLYDENDADGGKIPMQNVKELREEMRQLLTKRPSRNTAVDATILLKKMMSTDARVYEKGRRSDQINVIDCTKVISAIGKSGHKLAPQMALSVL